MEQTRVEPTKSPNIHVRVIYLANRTTHVELRDGKRIFGGKVDKSQKTEAHADFVELMDNGFKLDIPPRTCSIGHRLEFELEVHAPTQVVRFHAQGVVGHAETFPFNHDNIAVTLTQFDHTTWEGILNLYKSQQDHTLDLFKKLKGIAK